MDWLINFLEQALEWLLEAFLWVPRKLTELILDGLAFVIESIPVPAFFSNAGGFLGAIDPTIVFFLESFAFAEGMAIVFSAFVIRFIIRRLPVVG